MKPRSLLRYILGERIPEERRCSMRGRNRSAIMLATAAAGLLGLVMAAAAQYGGTATIQQQYEMQMKKLDHGKVDDIYNLAKWCLQNGLSGEAINLALEANQKAPDDVRPKYLLYALSGGAGVATESSEVTIETTAAEISDQEIDVIYNHEGPATLGAFGEIQKILISRCGSTRCHGGGSTAKWSLAKREPTSRKTLALNFRTVNAYINRDNVADSPFFQKPLTGKNVGHPETAFHGTGDPSYLKVLAWARKLKTSAQKIWDQSSTPAPIPTSAPAPAPAAATSTTTP